MKQSLAKIMDDEKKLKSYINTLELDIENTKNVDEKIDLVLDNILNMYSNFTDRRSLKASNIEAITNLLKLKSDLPMKRIQSKKLILDMMCKKTELEIKNKSAEASKDLAVSTTDFFKQVFLMLDQNKIHPKLNEEELIIDCNDIIDVQIEQPKEKDDINDEVSEINIEEIQKQLDDIQ